MKERSVIVHPSVKHEGRKLEAQGVLVGRACGLRDVIEVLRGARVGKGWDEGDVAGLPAIEWRDGGLEVVNVWLISGPGAPCAGGSTGR
ncbi:hypothetical protein [Streptomyces sp. NBC_00728]|uniref:hypothetical protein n=1 Tax=Streptomyces sp. NBC_00728 TaxID=2903676 RepID=UPI00386CDE10